MARATGAPPLDPVPDELRLHDRFERPSIAHQRFADELGFALVDCGAFWEVQAKPVHRCASPDCPGLPWRASESRHPCRSDAERIAEQFHTAYEILAPEHGYETRRESAKRWAEVPEQNRSLMVATVERLLRLGVIRAEGASDAREGLRRVTFKPPPSRPK